jgi:ribulose-bisphosphate carboxylase large chain
MTDEAILFDHVDALAPAPAGLLTADYAIETPQDPEKVAAEIAGEASTGTFVRVPGQRGLDDRHAARVIDVIVVNGLRASGLPCHRAVAGDVANHALVRISWPDVNTASLTACITATAGNVSELGSLTGVRLLDVRLPSELLRTSPLPPHGVEGTRRLVGVDDRPLFGTIIKPSVGLDPSQTAAMALAAASAGLDFLKDDELLCNPSYSPLAARVVAVEAALTRASRSTGRRAIFAYNITADSVAEMVANAELVVSGGGRCVMVNLNVVGLAAVRELRQETDLAIHGHRAGFGMVARSPVLGLTFQAYQTFWRASGIDHIHVSGLQSKFWEGDASVLRSIAATQRRLRDGTDDRVLPVLSSGQTARHVALTARATGHPDFLLLAGGGIWAHPDGARGGVRSLEQAWDSQQAGIPLEEYARNHKELAAALTTFGVEKPRQ